MAKTYCKCGHSKFWHNEEGCNHLVVIRKETTSGVYGIPYDDVISCKCKEFIKEDKGE